MVVTKKEKVDILRKLGYYNKKFGREATSLGFTRDEYYEIWKRNFWLWENEDNAFTIEEITDQILTFREPILKQPFRLILKSYMNPDMRIIYEFSNLYHFKNWKIDVLYKMTQTGDLDSAGYATVEYTKEESFKYALYDVEELAGGADSNALKPIRTFDGKYQKFTVRQVKTQHNNCGLECVKFLLGSDMSFLDMRKFLKVDANQPITIQQLIDIYNHVCDNMSLDKKLCVLDVDSEERVVYDCEDPFKFSEFLTQYMEQNDELLQSSSTLYQRLLREKFTTPKSDEKQQKHYDKLLREPQMLLIGSIRGFNYNMEYLLKNHLKSGFNPTYDGHYSSARKNMEVIKSLLPEANVIQIRGGSNQYILFHKDHYYVIQSSKVRPCCKSAGTSVKHGIIKWDVETRSTEDFCMIGNTKSYYVKDVILHADVKRYKSDKFEHVYFKTNNVKSSCRQFLDWLQDEGRNNRYYYLYAHNGGNFDLYFLLMNFSKEESQKYKPTLRGTTIIKLEYGNNIFLDTYCFLTHSLKKLTEDFQVEQKKMQSFIVDGKELTNEQLCFYKPELTFDQFLELEHSEPEFWKLYNDYCYADCVALRQVWEKFEASINKLIDMFIEIAPHREAQLKAKCLLRQSCTIGGHAQKILDVLNGTKGKNSSDSHDNNSEKKKKEVKMSYAYENYSMFIDNREKHDFIMSNFKRGGISHCNKKGKHTKGVMSVDICSQYPASMIHMMIPTGYSRFVDSYDPNAHGYYILKNLVFDTTYNFKPVCDIFTTGVLNWNTGNVIERVPLDSYMIKYLQQHYGLVSFEVEKGLVSNFETEGWRLFEDYVMTLFKQKANQDYLKKIRSEDYNEAYRSTIKLYLNAITGKLVMDKNKYTSLTTWSDNNDNDDVKSKTINGQKFKVESKIKSNPWVNAGVMVYSYSKRLLFEYIRQMPNNSDDVIHVETDSIYFPTSCEQIFNDNVAKYDGNYPVKYGDELGNIKVEQKTNMPAFFLNKKVYCMYDEHEKKYKFVYKGIPKATIEADGTKKQILTYELYEKVYNHKHDAKPITIEFATLSRCLFGDTRISAHVMTRTLNSSYDYHEY